jgi:hypothetical protein
VLKAGEQLNLEALLTLSHSPGWWASAGLGHSVIGWRWLTGA